METVQSVPVAGRVAGERTRRPLAGGQLRSAGGSGHV